MNTYRVYQKIIAGVLAVVFLIPFGLLVAPHKAEAGSCSFGGGGGGGDGGVQDISTGNEETFYHDDTLLIHPLAYGSSQFELASFGGNIFKLANVSTLPHTDFDASAFGGAAPLALGTGDASSIWQIAQVAIETVTQAVSCISSVANSITSFATDSLVVKEYALDSLAWALVNTIIADMLNDIQKWAITGFKGEPVFVTNIDKYFSDLADDVVGAFLNELAGVNLCSVRWKPLIEIALDIDIKYRQRAECTLTEIVENYDRYIEDITTGGWDTWVEFSVNPANNPYGAYILATEETANRIGKFPSGILDRETLKLEWGNGFISLPKCTFSTISIDGREVCTDASGNQASDEYEITTPGAMVEEYVNGANNTARDRLIVADEINETIVAILYGLAVKTFSDDGGYTNADYSGLSKAVGKGPGNSAFADVKRGFLDDVDGFRISEADFRIAKTEQLGIITTSKTVLESLIECRQNELVLHDQYLKQPSLDLIKENNPFKDFSRSDNEQRATSTLEIIDTKITPHLEPLAADVRQSEIFTKEINIFYEETSAVETFNELDQLTRFFFEMRARWHDPVEVARAEADTGFVRTEFKPITDQAQTDLAACELKRQDMRDFLKINAITPGA